MYFGTFEFSTFLKISKILVFNKGKLKIILFCFISTKLRLTPTPHHT